MFLHYEEAKGFAKELAKSTGEVVTVIGETQNDWNDGELQEFVNPDGRSIQGVLEAGIGNCRFIQFPFDCIKTDSIAWCIGFRGLRIKSLSPLNLMRRLVPDEHGFYPDPENPTFFDKLNAKECSCGETPHVYAVLKDGRIQTQLRCPTCDHEGPVELLSGDAAEAWNESLK